MTFKRAAKARDYMARNLVVLAPVHRKGNPHPVHLVSGFHPQT